MTNTTATDLGQAIDTVTGGRPATELTRQCGSDDATSHKLRAMPVSGLRGASLFASRWREGCRQPVAPAAAGAV